MRGGEGADKVHLTGSLKSGDPTIYASKTDLSAASTESEVAVLGMGDASGNVVNLFTGGVEIFTDALTNKTTTAIDAADFNASHVYSGTANAFTDYNYTPGQRRGDLPDLQRRRAAFVFDPSPPTKSRCTASRPPA